ncbi:MAG: O-antigen ligase domain-containing protein [Zetaproteobacteria bacterium]|nr:MAG: O-antigen ligase domain-containing protein [Zetaproteobacteria bacterium]
MDKYVRGVFPPRGSFPHQNSLGAFQNLLNFIIFAFLMGGKEKLFSKENLLMWVAFGAGSLTSLATLSRATMTTMILGYILTIGMSLYLKQKKRKKKKKLKSIGIIIMMTLPGLAVLLPPIIHRFETAPKESGESRIEANRQSAHMAHDHPLGVGINNYSFAINSLELPYARHLKPLDRGITHNIYYLTYAELGWIGLILHLTIIFTFMYVGIRFILRRRDSPERNFAIGALTAVLINALHQNLEWVVFREFAILTVYFIIVGTLCSMDRVEKERIRSEKREMMMQYYMLSMFMKRRRKRR